MFQEGKVEFGWINLFGAVFVILMLIPNIIYALKNKNEQNLCTNRFMNAAEQIGRYGCIVLMWLPLAVWRFGFASVYEMLLYMAGNMLLLAAYWTAYGIYLKKKTAKLALLLAVLPSCIFLMSGLLLRHWLLVGSAVLFAVGHIYVTKENTVKPPVHSNLLFDLDQTLLDFHASEHAALKEVMEKNDLIFTEERYDSFRKNNNELWVKFEKGNITKTQLFETRFRLLFEECDHDITGIDLLEVNSDFINCMAQNGILLNGADDLLKKITESLPDARIYIITNGVERNAMGRINSTGLDRFINEVFVSETMGADKPSRKYFDIVKKSVSEPDKSYIVIGDSLTSDMLGAKNSGLTSCWFMPSGDTVKAVKEYDIDYMASSYDELYDVIVKWILSR